MAELEFTDIGIRAISACVPKNIEKNKDLAGLIGEYYIDRLIATIGIEEKRVAPAHICASDLCREAAEHLISGLKLDRESIDVLIFLSQTPDYKTPITSALLQHRLKLPESVAAIDMNQACSGYVYGLANAYVWASQPHVNKVLLLVGETMSKTVSCRDKALVPYFGDCGTATLVEKGAYGKACFSLFTDGSGEDVIKIKAGGYRHQSTPENVVEREEEDGNIRSEHHMQMDGMEMFNFTIRVVQKSIRDILAFGRTNLSEIDYVLFHQTNRYITDYFSRNLKLPLKKTPYCLEEFGNTSSASIPLTIVTRMKRRLDDTRVLLSGFGAGLSWGTSLLRFTNCYNLPLIEV